MITIFEDYKNKLGNLPSSQLSDLKLAILKLKDLIGEQNAVLETDDSIRIKHYVGLYADKNISLQILPKIFDEGKNVLSAFEKAQNMLNIMLKSSGLINQKIIDQVISGDGKNNFIEELIRLFAEKSLNVILHNLSCGYVLKHEQSLFIKGKINISKTIRTQISKPYLFDISYFNYTDNILLNQIIKATALRLLIFAKDNENKKKLNMILLYLKDISIIPLSSEIFNKIVFTRLNNHYEEICYLAKMFFKNIKPSFFDGKETSFSMILPLNILFERYIFKKIKNILPSVNSLIEAKNQVSRLLYSYNNSNSYTHADIVLEKSGSNILILDTKYKNINSDISSDIYQMITYSNNYKCKDIVLVYPKFEDQALIEKEFILNYDKTIKIRKINIDLLNENATEKRLGEIIQNSIN